MSQHSPAAPIVGCALLFLGAVAGTDDRIRFDVRKMHLAVAGLFLVLTPLVAFVHCRRFMTKGPLDYIAWLHFVTFALFLFVAIRMIKRWMCANPRLSRASMSAPLTARYRGSTIDLSDFAKRHPGGLANIMKAKGRDLERVWVEENVAWHLNNPSVMAELAKMEKIG